MSYYNNGSYRRSDTSPAMLIVLLALVIILTSGMKACSRSDAHMIYLDNGYCYHETSHIIYIESETGKYGTKTNYTPYYDEDGNLARYNVKTGEWEVVTDMEESVENY